MLPSLLRSRLEILFGDTFSDMLHAFSQDRIGSLRINTLNSSPNEVLGEFGQKGIQITPYPLLENVYTFDRSQEYAIKGSDAFYQGRLYLQSIASLLPVIALDPQEGEHILDVCAAPGSKTTQLATMMNNTGSIVALEKNQIRYDKMNYNLRLQGVTNTQSFKMDAQKYLQAHQDSFDKILLDAPCSAEGRIQLHNEKSYGFWSLENIAHKASLQYNLLNQSLDHLRSGGTLIYSTCTLAPEENEGVIATTLAHRSDIKLLPIEIGVGDTSWWKHSDIVGKLDEKYFLTDWMRVISEHTDELHSTVRILPSHETEGFFLAKIQKK